MSEEHCTATIGILHDYLARLEEHKSDPIDEKCIEYVRATIEGRTVEVSPSITALIEGDLKRLYAVNYSVDPKVIKVRPPKRFDPSDGIDIPLYGEVAISIVPGARSFTTTLQRGESTIFRMDSKTKPWSSTKIQNDFASQAYDRIDGGSRLEKQAFKKKVLEAFEFVREQIETDPNTKHALTAPPVQRVIDATTRVDAYPSENTFYLVKIEENGVKKELQFTVGDVSEMDKKAGILNKKWLNAFPNSPLDATPDDSKEIRDAWLDIAEIHDMETITEIDTLIENLRERCGTVRAFKDRKLVTDPSCEAYYDEVEEIVYVPTDIVTALLKEQGKEHLTAKLSGELRHMGYMARGTQQKRIVPGSSAKRVWPLYAAFAKFIVSDRERPREVVDDVD